MENRQKNHTGYTATVLNSFRQQRELFKFLFSQSHEKNGVPKRLLCAFTGMFMEDPITMPDGYSYERKILQRWYENGNHCSAYKADIKLIDPKAVPTNTILLAEINDFRREQLK